MYQCVEISNSWTHNIVQCRSVNGTIFRQTFKGLTTGDTSLIRLCGSMVPLFELLTLGWSLISSWKVVSGGRAPGKRSSLAPPQLSVTVLFYCFGAVRLGKVQFLYCNDSLLVLHDKRIYIYIHMHIHTHMHTHTHIGIRVRRTMCFKIFEGSYAAFLLPGATALSICCGHFASWGAVKRCCWCCCCWFCICCFKQMAFCSWHGYHFPIIVHYFQWFS